MSESENSPSPPASGPAMLGLRAALESPGGAAALEERVRQMEKFGHTSGDDLEHPVVHIPNMIVHDAAILRDACLHGEKQDLKRALKYAKRVAAMAMAAFDRIEHEIALQHASAPPPLAGTATPVGRPETLPSGVNLGGQARPLPAVSSCDDLFPDEAAA